MANKRAPLLPEHAAEWRIDLNDGRDHTEVLASHPGWWECRSCGNLWQESQSSRRLRKWCRKCAGKQGAEVNRGNAATVSRIAVHLQGEWVDEKPHTSVSAKSNYKAAWRCGTCGHEWRATVKNRSNGSGCPECYRLSEKTGAASARSRAAAKSDPLSDYPIAAWWSDRNPHTPEGVSRGSTEPAWWNCSTCGTEFSRTPKGIRSAVQCEACSYTHRGTSYAANAATTNPLSEELRRQLVDPTLGVTSAGSNTKLQWLCADGHMWWAAPKDRGRGNGCPACAKHISRAEIEVADFVRTLTDDVATSTRTVIAPNELDIYIPSKSVAVEFNGLYWHSEDAGKDRHYHQRKWQRCADKGIQMVTVWEDDWRDRRDICQRMIARKLGVSQERRLNARSLTVTTVDRVEARDFLEANHIQGATAMSEAFGLRDGGELVAVMCMKWRTKSEVELVRFATSAIVRGGHSRLLKHAVAAMQPQRVVTFADHAVSDGGLYEQCGFGKDAELRPDYTYYFRGERVHKFLFRLKRFRNDPNLLWDESWTEQQAAAENKIPRIWDYGKTRYVLDIPA